MAKAELEMLDEIIERLQRDPPPVASVLTSVSVSIAGEPAVALILLDKPNGKALAVSQFQAPEDIIKVIRMLMSSASRAFGSEVLVEQMHHVISLENDDDDDEVDLPH